MSEFAAPAETYKLNTLASVLGRYAVPNPSSETLTQVGEMLDVTIDDIMTHDAPPVPHTRAELLEEALTFDHKLLRQLHKGPAGQHITGVQRSTVEGLLNQHAEYCLDTRQRDSSWQMLTTTDAIAKAYGLRELWSSPDSVIAEEVSRWGRDTIHPEVPPLLAKRVSLAETKQLMGLMWRRVIGAEHDPDVNVYLTDDVDNYHVYWSPTAERLDYATPRSYDRATQLSFDLPHNATHLAHLDAMRSNAGATRYDDSMALRAYFEAVTVFSERQTIGAADKDPEFQAELAQILGVPPEGSAATNLAEWVVADRKYEFKLRAARYMADVLMTTGVAFDDTIAEISSTFGIPLADAVKETRKYLAWTGLGAAYTFGYRQLEAAGVTSVMDAIKSPQGEAITSWTTFPRPT